MVLTQQLWIFPSKSSITLLNTVHFLSKGIFGVCHSISACSTNSGYCKAAENKVSKEYSEQEAGFILTVDNLEIVKRAVTGIFCSGWSSFQFPLERLWSCDRIPATEFTVTTASSLKQGVSFESKVYLVKVNCLVQL